MLLDEIRQLYKSDPPVPGWADTIYQNIIKDIKEAALYGAKSYEVDFDHVLSKSMLSVWAYTWAKQYIVNRLETDDFKIYRPMWNGIIVSGWAE